MISQIITQHCKEIVILINLQNFITKQQIWLCLRKIRFKHIQKPVNSQLRQPTTETTNITKKQAHERTQSTPRSLDTLYSVLFRLEPCPGQGNCRYSKIKFLLKLQMHHDISQNSCKLRIQPLLNFFEKNSPENFLLLHAKQ
ncbi:hypothetical protein CEXT_736831 [Caerostris extrusa]|uniref:Uncharacterized protein n=1 Tax=Caerostris extrusa TaxID=172846 RepID=A0AAV4UFM1_CAEEX|nr:hypothetical protein CEXT_736831 [Caerostris extrusa]